MITKGFFRNVQFALVGVVVLVAAGCSMDGGFSPSTSDSDIVAPLGVNASVSSSSASAGNVLTVGSTLSIDLLAGQHINAGSVDLTVVGDELVVVYNVANGWTLEEVHFWIGTDPAGIPQNRQGNPVIGHFAYTDAGSLVFPVEDFDLESFCDQELFVAPHAVVRNEYGKTETAWAAGTRMVTRGSWAIYASFVIECTRIVVGDSFPVWPQDISHVVLVFDADGGYYIVKIDNNWPGSADNDLDNSIQAILRT